MRSTNWRHDPCSVTKVRSAKQRTARITTEIIPAPPFYYAEDYHQQYLAKNPGGYCGLGGTGVGCPTGVAERKTSKVDTGFQLSI